jgi:hypothetical protein
MPNTVFKVRHTCHTGKISKYYIGTVGEDGKIRWPGGVVVDKGILCKRCERFLPTTVSALVSLPLGVHEGAQDGIRRRIIQGDYPGMAGIPPKPERVLKIGTIAWEGRRLLEEAGRPMRMDKLVAGLRSAGYDAKRVVIAATFYKKARKGQVFVVVEPGVIGLLVRVG